MIEAALSMDAHLGRIALLRFIFEVRDPCVRRQFEAEGVRVQLRIEHDLPELSYRRCRFLRLPRT